MISFKNAIIIGAVAFAAVGADARGQRGGRSRRGRMRNNDAGVAASGMQFGFGERERNVEGGRSDSSRGGRGVRGGRGRGGKGGKGGKGGRRGKGGVVALEVIEACSEEITLTCSLGLDFDLDALTDQLAELSAAKEEAEALRREEHENRHARVLEGCPALVDYCGLPLELPEKPTRAQGERPTDEAREEAKAYKQAMKCISQQQDEVEVSEVCSGVLADLQAERAEHKEARENDERERPELSQEVKEMMKAMRQCLQEDVRPGLDELDEDSTCLAALSRREHGDSQSIGEPDNAIQEPAEPQLAGLK